MLDLMVRARAQRNQISLPCICLHGDLSGSGVGATFSAPGGRRPLRRDFLFCGRRRSGARIYESLDAGSDESLDAGSDESLDESIDAGSDESPGESSGESLVPSSGEGIGKSIAASSGESLGPRIGKRISKSISKRIGKGIDKRIVARRIGATASQTFRQPARAGPMERARGLGRR